MRNRIYKPLKGNVKSSSTKDLLGIDIELCRMWIEYQMSPELNWNDIHIDLVKPILSYDVSKDEELREAFNCKSSNLYLKKTILKEVKKMIFSIIKYSLLIVFNSSN